MQAVILAAGKSSRFALDGFGHKLLTPFFGIPIIKRTVLAARFAGIKDIIIVTGFKDKEFKKLLGDGSRWGVKITYQYNKQFSKENGISLLAAKKLVDSPFVLLMGDDIFDPYILKDLLKARLYNNESLLAVDFDIKKVYDVGEATKVVADKDGQIKKIGKKVTGYNGVDTGIFLLDRLALTAMEEAVRDGKERLAEGMQVLASQGRLKAYPVEGRYWVDVDTANDYEVARKKVINQIARGKPADGFISRRVNRFFSIMISSVLAPLGIEPNVISVTSFFIVSLASLLFLSSNYLHWIVAGLLVQFGSIVDGCDGEIARFRLSMTAYGAWFDTILDRYADLAVATTISYRYLASQNFHPLAFSICFLMLAGIILTSYSRKEYRINFEKDYKSNRPILLFLESLNRDARLFIVFVTAILGHPEWSIFILAFISNLQVVNRFVVEINKREYLKG